jgi:hypothetical protein
MANAAVRRSHARVTAPWVRGIQFSGAEAVDCIVRVRIEPTELSLAVAGYRLSGYLSFRLSGHEQRLVRHGYDEH